MFLTMFHWVQCTPAQQRQSWVLHDCVGFLPWASRCVQKLTSTDINQVSLTVMLLSCMVGLKEKLWKPKEPHAPPWNSLRTGSWLHSHAMLPSSQPLYSHHTLPRHGSVGRPALCRNTRGPCFYSLNQKSIYSCNGILKTVKATLIKQWSF